MKVRTNFRLVRPRVAMGAVMSAAMMLVSLGVGAHAASASSSVSVRSSSFCSTVFGYHPTAVPNVSNLKSYRAWAKSLEPFYERLASEAPNAATKSVLNEVVVVLKYYANSSSIGKLDASIVKYHAKWAAGSAALAKAIESCAKTLE